MRFRIACLLVICGAPMVFACTSPEQRTAPIVAVPDVPPVDPVRDNSPVQTDAVSYQLVRGAGEYRATAVATYRNRSNTPVYFVRCVNESSVPMWYVRRTGPDSTRHFFSDYAWACVGGTPVGSIAPGESVTVHVRLGSFDQPSMQPPLHAEDLTGLLRVELELCSREPAAFGVCERLPAAERGSNAFNVHY